MTKYKKYRQVITTELSSDSSKAKNIVANSNKKNTVKEGDYYIVTMYGDNRIYKYKIHKYVFEVYKAEIKEEQSSLLVRDKTDASN